MIFRVFIFVLLVIVGYYLSRKLRPNKLSSTLVGIFLVLVTVGLLLLSKRVFALFGFSFYLVLILAGLLTGFLAGSFKQKTSGQ